MSQEQVQTQVRVIEVLKRYNVKVEDIEKLLQQVLFAEGKVLTYWHDTWGSCRETKLVVVNKDGTFPPGEWMDKSSRKNAHKFKYTAIDQMPEEFIVYYYESPSCNKAKQFSFRVIARLVK